ncbi:MAG TPA: hypothetical protein VFW40_10390 [Capsulimonadaceae bacterium]|nr:hypothetical protein [Capsulimonadaceae bacterium]
MSRISALLRHVSVSLILTFLTFHNVPVAKAQSVSNPVHRAAVTIPFTTLLFRAPTQISIGEQVMIQVKLNSTISGTFLIDLEVISKLL